MLKNHFVNTLAITLVAFAIYSSPTSYSSSVVAGISGNANLAAASTALNNSTVSTSSRVVCPTNLVCTPIPPQPKGCPSGYTCTVVPITVVSPNGDSGETYYVGGTVKIKWNYVPVIEEGITKFALTLIDSNGKIVTNAINGGENNYPLITLNTYYSWSIPSFVAPGKYKVMVSLCPTVSAAECQSVINRNPFIALNDISDNYFVIKSSAPAVTSEQVKCIFNGAVTEQKCYTKVASPTSTTSTTTVATFTCTGVGSCVANITAPKGTRLYWYNSCSNTDIPITTVDGQSETVNFACISSPIISNLGVKYGSLSISSTDAVAAQKFVFNASITAGNYPMYISKDGPTAFPMTIGTTTLTIMPTGMTSTDSAGDSSSYFYIAPGQTKFLSANYLATGSYPSSTAYPQVYGINYGTSTANLSAIMLRDAAIPNTLKATLFH